MAEFEEILVDPFKETGKDVQRDSDPSDECSGREMKRNDSDGDPLHVKNDLHPSDEGSGREMKRDNSDGDLLYVQNNSDASDESSCRECKRDDSDREIKEMMVDSLHVQNDSDSPHEPTGREWKSDDSDVSSDEERKWLIQKAENTLFGNKPVQTNYSEYIPDTEYGVYDKSVYEYTRLSEILKMERRYRFSWDYMWDREPIIDLQYLFLYDYMEDNHEEQVKDDRHVILLRGECKSQIVAKELASQYHHCSVPMSEFDIDYCLTDLVEEYMVLEELEIFKRYELFLLKQYQENAEYIYIDGPYYPKPPPEFQEPTPKFITYRYSFDDVMERFREWIKKLENSTDAEKLEALERSNEERKLRFRLNTRATFVREKLQMANEDGIICLKDLYLEIENNLGKTPQTGKVKSVLMKYCSDTPVII